MAIHALPIARKGFPNIATAALLGASLLTPTALAADTFPELAITDMPATCRLLPSELHKREATLLADLRKQIVKAHPLPDGYALFLTMNDAMIRLAADVITVERQCCPFLQFRLTVAQESRALLLELRGPAGSRELLAQVLRLDGPMPCSSSARTEENDRAAHQGDDPAAQIPAVRRRAFDNPHPTQRTGQIDRGIRGVSPAGVGGLDFGQRPSENEEGNDTGRYDPRWAIQPQPGPEGVTAANFSERRDDIPKERFHRVI